MRKYDFVEDIYCDSLNNNIKGFFDVEKIKILKKYSSIQSVLLGMEFRPDKIATYYLGNSNYSWAIDLANNFEDGIKEYYVGRKILIPDVEKAYYELSNS